MAGCPQAAKRSRRSRESPGGHVAMGMRMPWGPLRSGAVQCPSSRWRGEPASLHTHLGTQTQVRQEKGGGPDELRPQACLPSSPPPWKRGASRSPFGGVTENPNCSQFSSGGSPAHGLSYCFSWVFVFGPELGLQPPRKASPTSQDRRVQHVVSGKGGVPGARLPACSILGL